MEIWNLVFMEKERGEGTGKDNFEIVGDLPKKNIDTGLGVERVACLLQDVDNVYETDLLRPVIDAAEKTQRRDLWEKARGRRAVPCYRRPFPHRNDAHS